jgi:putative ABC transport system substrate-binding protein
MSDRRAFVRALAAGLLIAPFPAASVPKDNVRRVGWLHLGQPWNLNHFRDKLRDLGWVEGRNLAIDARFADNDERRLPALAAELVELGVDVIVTQTTPAAMAAKNATGVIPIVMAGSSSPERIGLVGSLARPGGNVTGLTNNPGTGFGIKLTQLLKDAAPQVSRLAVIDRSGAGSLPPDAPIPGVAVIMAVANTAAQLPSALADALRQRADGLFIPSNGVNEAEKQRVADFALAHRLPAIGGSKDLVWAGLLMSYWADWSDIRRQTAVYVDKILKGANPAELPVERPSTFELAINLSTARALGLKIPHALMLRADELFE